MQNIFFQRIAMIIILPLIIASCARLAPESSSVMPTTIQLQHFRKVALFASEPEVKVRYARYEEAHVLPFLAAVGSFIGFLPLVAGEVTGYRAGSSQDKIIKGQLQNTAQGWSISERLSRYTIEEINKGRIFEVDAAQGRHTAQLVADRYDGFIDIALDEISFQRDGNSKKLHILIRGKGKMTELATGSVVWKRDELVGTHQPHTIAEYTAKQGHILKKEIDNLLRELSFRLASDLIYVP